MRVSTPLHTMTSYRKKPVNLNVTINSDDSCVSLPPYDVINGGYLSIIMLLYIAITHACISFTMTLYRGYLSIIMLL